MLLVILILKYKSIIRTNLNSKFNGVYSTNNLPKTKDGAYVINLDEYESIGTDENNFPHKLLLTNTTK